MKKFFCLAISLVMILFALCACTPDDLQSIVTGHTHTYSDKWSNDAVEHWHSATCEHNMLRKDVAAHSFVDGVCSVCGAPNLDYNPVVPGGYEFGDDVSRQNDKFYEDYSPADKELYYTLWAEDTEVRLSVDITPHELAKIDEAYDDYCRGDATKADTYRRCNLTITVNGTDYYYEEVGIRMRGNTSRREFCTDDGDMFAFVHFRFSLSETFDGDEYADDSWGAEIRHDWSADPDGRAQRKDRAFATMEKFYYKWNKNYDNTYIREVYANRMFQAYGILAPHITLTQLSVMQGGDMASCGVGGLYEIVDKQFIKRNFDKSRKGGDLYKCTYSVKGPADFTNLDPYTVGVETPFESFSYDLKTNDDPTDSDWSNHRYLYNFAQMLNSPQSGAEWQSQLESMVDMDYFTRFEAVNYLLGNPDCIRNHANNFYLYFTPEDENGNFRAYIIPYDYDRCLGITQDWNMFAGMTETSPYTTEGTDMSCVNPLYTRTILDGGIAQYRSMYTARLKEVLNGVWFNYSTFDSLYNAYKSTYQMLARPSHTILVNCGANVQMDRFAFGDDGISDFYGNYGNISARDYFNAKMAATLRALDN